MKYIKIGLVSLLLIGSNAFAIDNIKSGGDIKFFYSTDNSNSSLLQKESAIAQGAVGISLNANLDKNIKANIHLTALSTLGLENQLVDGIWEGTNGTYDSYWFDQVYLTTNIIKITVLNF